MFKNLNCIAFFLLPWLIIGCSTTSRVNLDSPENTIEEINEVSQDRDVRIRKTDRTLLMGTDLSIRNDTVRWSGMNTEQAKELPLDEVAQIQIIKRNKGARRGLIYGISAGTAIGGTLYLFSISNTSNGPASPISAEGLAIAYTSILTIGGAISGSVIGAGRGYLITYHFEERNMPDAADQE